MSVYKASILYGIPESTLRDRTRGLIPVEVSIGYKPIFTMEEEKNLAEHIKYMASIGYGYNRTGIKVLAREYAVSLGKVVKSETSLSNCWFYTFMKRWTDLKVVSPQKLTANRAEAASRETLNTYFNELDAILTKCNLKDKPAQIYNVDETGISTEHTPPMIVCGQDVKPQAITSPRSSTTTIIAAGNAVGNHVPPYYVFKGKRWNNNFLDGAPPGSNGKMSESGWSNTAIFTHYITSFFASHVGITDNKDQATTLILYDGHKSHVNLTLTNWAKRHNTVLFVLPPHTSHLTQPLDVAVFGPFKSMYNKECQMFLQKNPGINITKNDVAKLTSRPYMRAMSPENLVSAFRRTGIYPFNNTAILDSEVAPATIYNVSQNASTESEHPDTPDTPVSVFSESQLVAVSDVLSETNNQHDSVAQSPQPQPPDDRRTLHDQTSSFLNSRKIITVVKRTKKKFVPPFITGDLSNAANQENLEAKHNACKKSENTLKTQSKSQSQKRKSTTMDLNNDEAGPSGFKTPGKTTEINDSFDSTDEEEIDESEKCCVCHKFQPEEFKHIISLTFVKWAKCDDCGHWTHLKYCTPVKVIRLHDKFTCPHCE